jgi:glutamate dehydrogenase (NAD(P)+)
MNKGHSVLGVVTGKPLTIGGSLGRQEATARGSLYCIRDAIRKRSLSIDSLRVAIQGFGNVGSHLARLLAADGARVVALSDSAGGLYNPNGIDIDKLIDYRLRNGSVTGFKGAEAHDSAELLVKDCDILIPAATENVITSRNADKIKAKIIAEGANGPTTAVADDILADKNIFVIPDILANAGGVTASYFEWVQDRQGFFWKESVVNEQLEDILRESFEEVVRYSETHNVNNRIAAYMLAVDRVQFTIRQRGIYA